MNVEAFPDGFPVNQQALFGNGIVYDGDGNISGAKAVIQVRRRGEEARGRSCTLSVDLGIWVARMVCGERR